MFNMFGYYSRFIEVNHSIPLITKKHVSWASSLLEVSLARNIPAAIDVLLMPKSPIPVW